MSSSIVSPSLLLCLAAVAALSRTALSRPELELEFKTLADNLIDKNSISPQLQNCTRLEFAIDCSGKGFLSLPSSIDNIETVSFRNNSIKAVNLTLTPFNIIQVLDLSYNQIKSIVGPSEPAVSLERLDLRANRLTEFNMSTLTQLRSLDLSENQLDNLDSSNFSTFNKLEQLNLSKNNLTKLNELAFGALKDLQELNISEAGILKTIPDKLFENNTNLKTLDLSLLKLTEVPVAIRSISGLKVLYFRGNLMSSLRESDLMHANKLQVLDIQESPRLTKVDEFAFKNLANLDELVVSGNPRLQFVSKDAFESDGNNITLSKLDLSHNNLTTLENIFSQPGLSVSKLILDGNNWHCDCNLIWLLNIPTENRSLVHCKSPEEFREIELVNLKTINCEPPETGGSNQVIIAFVSLILLAVVMALLVQRVQFVRRLFWKDQYGSIYYTKASFSLEPR